jgi:hypothetical protein
MKLHHSIYFSIVLATALTQFSGAAYSAENESDQRKGRRGPPQVAIDACASLSEGDSCSFSGRNDKELSGTCFAPPQRDDLACRPDDHEERRGKQGKGHGRNSESVPE